MIPYCLTDSGGRNRLVLNYTFWMAEHASEFQWGVTPTPRTHGYRAIDTAYLNGKSLMLQGIVASGAAGGALPFGSTPMTAVDYFDDLRQFYAALHAKQRGILDYRNGLIQYVLFGGMRAVQVEGWPDLRAVAINLLCEDPLAYAIVPATGTISGSTLSITVGGTSPTNNYRLRIAASGLAKTVVVRTVNDGPGLVSEMTLTLPVTGAGQDPLTINGWQKTVYMGTSATPAWSHVHTGSILPTLYPGLNRLIVLESDGLTGANIDDFDHTDPVQIEITAHAADWMADSWRAPGNLPGGEYDLSQYDVDVYG